MGAPAVAATCAPPPGLEDRFFLDGEGEAEKPRVGLGGALLGGSPTTLSTSPPSENDFTSSLGWGSGFFSDQDQDSTTNPGSDQDQVAGSDDAEPQDSPAVRDSGEEHALPPTPPPGLTEEPSGGLVSRGSAMHGAGNCTPCAWFWKPIGCQNDKDCSYCHICPDGAVKARKKAKMVTLREGKGQVATPKVLPATSEQASVAGSPPATPASSASRFALSLASLV
jgi:hypothetical protein